MNAPNETSPTTDQLADQPQADSPHRGRPPVLGPAERRRLIALLEIGCSRRVAARCVGCAPNTIARTAARDPQFAHEIVNAEAKLEVKLLQSISKAADDGRYWRAAGWLLERKNSTDFVPQPPHLFTAEQTLELFSAVIDTLREEISLPQRERAIEKLAALLLELDPDTPHTDHYSSPAKTEH